MVSIILCTYNRAHTLKATIDSILAQTYTDFELVLVDDGSTDRTQELLAEYSDERIRSYVLEENSFYCAAANFGLTKAKGEYIAFATSDDTWKCNKLMLQIEYLEKRQECGACFTFANVINESGEENNEQFKMLSELFNMKFHSQKEWIQRFLFEGNCLCHPSAVVRREVMEAVGDYNLLYCQSADLDMWIRIARRCPIHVINQQLVNYRCGKLSDKQISEVNELKSARFLNEFMMIRRAFVRDLNDEEMVRFFGDCFRNSDACSHLEMEIEKAFLLLNCCYGLPELRVLGIEKFEEILHNPESVRILEKTYHVHLKDIYKWNLAHFYMDFGIHVRLAENDKTIRILREKVRKEEEYNQMLREQKKEINEKLNSAVDDIKKLKSEILEWQKKNAEQEEKLQNERQKYVAAELQIGMKVKELEERKKENEDITKLLNQTLLNNLESKEKKGIRKWKNF